MPEGPQPANPEDVEAAIDEAEAALALTGVGYPTGTSEARTTLRTAIDNISAMATPLVSDLSTFTAAIATYKSSADVQMPEDGKAYTITNVQKDGTKFQLHYTAASGLTIGDANVAYNGAEATFICKEVNGKYVFVFGSGKYLNYKGNGAASSGAEDVYNENRQSFNLTNRNSSLFGSFTLCARRDDNTTDGTLVIKKAEKTFDGYSNVVGLADNYSNLFILEEVPYANVVKLNASGIEGVGNLGTFSAPFATEIPAGVTAYYGASTGDDYVSLTAIEGSVIPANEGVVLESAAETSVTMVPAIEAGAAIENKLANTAGQAKTDIGANDYVLAADKNDGNKAAFCKLASGTVAMNKAYLVMSGASAVKLVFGGTATGIEDAVEADDAAAPVYDLAGRKVSAPVKGGIYVKNGKKFIF